MADKRGWLGRYQLVDRIARGGMGEIYLAHTNGNPGEPVVLKVVRARNLERRHVQMFLDEARVSTLVSHPNVVKVYEVDYSSGTYFMAMERLRGVSLAELMSKAREAGKYLPLRMITRIGIDVCAALTAVHECTTEDGRSLNLVHRDVSPGNLFVTHDGIIKLLDFGVAKSAVQVGQTALGLIKGTAPYMSPEQVRGNPLDPRSDMFSVGTILYECLVGDRLFKKDTLYETLSAVCFKPLTPPTRGGEEIPASLAAAVLSALSRERDKRVESAAAMAQTLQGVADEFGGCASTGELSGFVAALAPESGRVGRETQTVTSPGDLQTWADSISERLAAPAPNAEKKEPAPPLDTLADQPGAGAGEGSQRGWDPFDESDPGETVVDNQIPGPVLAHGQADHRETATDPLGRDARPTMVDPMAGARYGDFQSLTPSEPVSAEVLAIDPSAPEFVAFTPVDFGGVTPASVVNRIPVRDNNSLPRSGENNSGPRPRATTPEQPPGFTNGGAPASPRLVAKRQAMGRRRRSWLWVLALAIGAAAAAGGFFVVQRGVPAQLRQLLPRR